jgi:hypothetical protein
MGEGSGQRGVRETERRQSFRLRSVFDSAYEIVEPFLAPESGWVGHSLAHLTYRVVRENFSELTSEEVHSLLVSAHRVYIDRYPENSDHLPRPAELRQSVLRNRVVVS